MTKAISSGRSVCNLLLRCDGRLYDGSVWIAKCVRARRLMVKFMVFDSIKYFVNLSRDCKIWHCSIVVGKA